MTNNFGLRHILIFCLLLLNAFAGNKNVFAICGVPTGLTTTNITPTSAKLNWLSIACDSFLIRYNTVNSPNYFYKTIKPGNLTNYVITGLYPFTSYNWVIHTYCNGGTSGAYQTPVSFTTAAGTVSCIIPNKTATTSIGPSSAVISWNSAITADSFLIRYALHNTTSYTWKMVPGSAHSYTFTNLPSNTSYDWTVRCVCASAPTQSYSVINSFTTLSSNCSTADPYYFTNTNIGAYSTFANWKAVAGAVSYNLRYAVRFSNNWTTVSSVTPMKPLQGLTSNTWYEWQVQVVCASGAGVWSTSGIFQTTNAILTVTRGPYIQLSTTSSTFLRWRTNNSSDSKVSYGTNPLNLLYSVTNNVSTTEHIVQITGLAANTKYYYSIGSTGVTLQGDTGNYFRTNPPIGSNVPVRIWTIGDFGVSSNGQYQVRDAYMNYAGSANTNLWLWVGDNAYSDGTDIEYSNNVFSKYPYQMKKWCIWPATGNHDLHSANAANQTGPYFDMFTLPKAGEAGGTPSNTEAYYSFNYANIHFICLESTDAAFRATNGAMATWLTNDLLANTQRWTIVYFHHPPYSKGSHNSDTDIEMVQMRTNIVPILENHNVDLVLSGHSHAYERSMMLKGHFGLESTFNSATMAVNPGSGIYPSSYVKSSPNFSGTVYVVVGVSGQIGGSSSGWPHNAMYAASINHYGSLVMDVVGDRLDCKFLTNIGTIYDQFTIQKSGVSPFRLNVESDPAVPAANKLLVFPNPVIKESTIRYQVDKDSSVRLEITDMTGRVIYSLLNGEQKKGEYDIKLSKSEAVLPAGIYFVRLIVGDQKYNQKILVRD